MKPKVYSLTKQLDASSEEEEIFFRIEILQLLVRLFGDGVMIKQKEKVRNVL